MQPGWRKQYVRYKAYLLNTVAQYQERRDVKIYLEILLSLATISIFAVFAVKPTLVTIAGLLQDIKSKEETIAILDKKIDALSQADRNYQSQRSNILILDTTIPKGPNPEALVRQIEGLSTQTTASIDGFNVGSSFILGNSTAGVDQGKPKKNQKAEEQFPEGAQPLPLSINITGNYRVLSDFLAKLEKLRRPVSIDRLTFTNKPNEDVSVLQLVVGSRTPYVLNTK